jgi:hypothetical protein
MNGHLRFAICINKMCGWTYKYKFGQVYTPLNPLVGSFKEGLLEEPPRHCKKCGWPMVHGCPNCGRELDRIPTEEERHCQGCGADLLSVELVAQGPSKQPRQLEQ